MQVYEEGTHLMIPWFEWPYIYDVRARPNVIQSTSGSRDLQMVSRCIQLPLRFSGCLCMARAVGLRYAEVLRDPPCSLLSDYRQGSALPLTHDR